MDKRLKEYLSKMSRRDRISAEYLMQEITGDASVFARMQQGEDFFSDIPQEARSAYAKRAEEYRGRIDAGEITLYDAIKDFTES